MTETATKPATETTKEVVEAEDTSFIDMVCAPFGDLLGNNKSGVPPPPPGSIDPATGILRNGSLRAGEDLLKYTTAGESCKTLFDGLEFGAQRNPQADCLGKRVSATSDYTWASYKDVQAQASHIGAYLKTTLAIEPNQRVGLSGKNAPEYLTAINGCFWAGLTTVPIYDTFGETECQYIIQQADVQAVFVSAANLSRMLEWTKSFPSVKKIIVWGSTDERVADDDNDKVITFEECLKLGKEAEQTTKATPPQPSDLAIIMYTSGTTGMPKGVMLPHSALIAAISAMERYFDVVVKKPITCDDIFISYLPLAHVFDFYCEFFFLFRGGKIGYYRGDQKTLVDDIGALKPTIFVAVPRVFERIYKRVNGLMGESKLKKMLFDFFFAQKLSALQSGTPHDKASAIGDALVFSKIKQRLGGRVRFICSGGAPLPQHLEEWLKVCMCCPVVQGYGLTETCAASCVSTPDSPQQLGTVGPPLFSSEAKLDPVPEMGYDGTPTGGGEICFRGPSIMSGYYEKPDVTAEVLKDDGWFHTGDIGKFVNGGCIQIVDRKKQLFKLSQGEYVSPEKVEGIAAKSALVSQIFVHGTSTESVLVAVVVPSEDVLKQHGTENLSSNESLKQEILKDLDTICRSEKLKGYEIPKGVVLYDKEWTPESGFITPSFKLKRPTLKKHFETEITELYASLNSKA